VTASAGPERRRLDGAAQERSRRLGRRRSGNHETRVRAGGVDLFVRERGHGHPLLLINGLGANVEMWGPCEERLSAASRTIVFDAPGTGRSSTPAWPLSIPAVSELVADALDQLGYEQVDVLGFSLGGQIAQELAHRAPDRVRRLALCSTACGWGSMPGTPEALALIALPQRYYSRSFSEQTNWLLSPADDALLRRLTALTAARLRHPPSLFGYMSQLWAGSLWSSLGWLSSVQVPTLLIHGAEDRLVPAANSVQLARLLPRSRLHLLPDEGHFIVFDPDSSTVSRLQDFFTKRTLKASSAWSSGAFVDDDETVEAAFADSVGTEPFRTMSEAYRRLVGQGRRNGSHAG
jgi:poly(3-hydroxyoctanoate) depolymerase